MKIRIKVLKYPGDKYEAPLDIIGSTRRDGQTSTRLNMQPNIYTSALPTPTNEEK